MMDFQALQDFIQNKMRMSDIYQTVMYDHVHLIPTRSVDSEES